MDGVTVGKLVESLDIYNEILPQENAEEIRDGVNKIITKLTD